MKLTFVGKTRKNLAQQSLPSSLNVRTIVEAVDSMEIFHLPTATITNLAPTIPQVRINILDSPQVIIVAPIPLTTTPTALPITLMQLLTTSSGVLTFLMAPHVPYVNFVTKLGTQPALVAPVLCTQLKLGLRLTT